MNLKICLFILNTLSYIQFVSSYSLHAEDEYKIDVNGICRNGYCGSDNYSHILKVYRGLFHSTKELLMLDNVNNKALATPLSEDHHLFPVYEPAHAYVDDGAICCSTNVQHKLNTSMTNIFGETMSILHLSDAADPSYQYISHASCVQNGSCLGECVIESKIITLLALDTDQVLTFGLFAVPGYCSCKNIETSGKY